MEKANPILTRQQFFLIRGKLFTHMLEEFRLLEEFRDTSEEPFYQKDLDETLDLLVQVFHQDRNELIQLGQKHVENLKLKENIR